MSDPFDIVIIGGGAGGLVVASGAAQLGARVALVEKERGLGGDCLYYGCVPTKTLVHSARMLSLIRRSAEFGLGRMTPSSESFEGVMARMRGMVARIGEHDDPKRFEAMGIQVYFGEGRFVDPHTFEIAGRKIKGRRFVLATGARPSVPPIPGLVEAGFLTNVTALALKRRPETMAILGGGPVGVEFAQIFHRLGVRVTLIEKADRLLPNEDREISEALEAILRKEGIDLLTGAAVQAARREGNQKVLLVQEKEGRRIAAEEILVAAGRSPNVEGLGLDAAGVAYDRQGVKVDATLRTAARHIWACGDLVGPYQFTHMAEYQAGLVVANALFPLIRRKVDYRVVPWVTFTDPEVGRVGLTEQEARERLGALHVYRFPFKQVDRAIIEGEEAGFIKLIADRRLRIVGAHLIGSNAGDLLHEYVLAMKANLKITSLSTTIHVYPTRSQGVKKAADQYYREKLFSGWFPKLARWLIRF
ncbi:MAG: mercuric reductase [Candidatus Manganitrophaceae bacterium]|nr:MAG: mercuric reductase [Candidatus Manganitrophaceae bacterium]